MKLYFLFVALLFRQFSPDFSVYPEVWRNETFKETIHGIEVHDPYRWLENIDSPEVIKFVKEQNDITLPYLNRYSMREKIRNSLTRLVKYPIYSPPKKKGKYYFTMESSGSQSQKALYVSESLEDEGKKILLDPNIISSDGTISISRFSPSENGEIVAYGLSQKGSDWFSVHFKNVSTGEDFPEVLANTKFTQFSWTHDNKGIFYSRYPSLENRNNSIELGRDESQKTYYHLVGTKQSEDVLVVEFLEHPLWSTAGEVSDDGKYLIVYIEETLGPVQVHYIDLDSFIRYNYPSKPVLTPVITNFDSEYHYVTNEGSLFIFRTNRKAPNYRLVGINFYNPAENYWDHNLLPEDPHHVLDWATVVDRDKLVVSYLKDVKSSLQIRAIDGKKIIAKFPEEVGIVWSRSGTKRDTEFFYKLGSILTPGKIFRVDFKNDDLQPKLYKESLIPGFNDSEFIVEQKFYKSKDGTRIPMFLAYKKDIKLGPNTPCLLYGYGGFNSITAPNFEPENLIFMKHFNGIYALANIRGGGEYGEKWYNAGRKFKKQNVFDDFQSAAEFLVNNNYTSSSKLTIRGISNGGLLVAACINQRPELYGAAIAQVGVMDMIRFHKFTVGLAWTSDYGNPDNETQFKYLLTYSPLHNVRMPEDNITQYPSTLLVTADHDDRVVPSHSFKLIAELQHVIGRNPRQTNPLLIRVITDAGHGSGKSIAKQIAELADILAFIQKALKLEFEE